MEQTRLPTLQEVEQLTSYLPLLYADGFSPVLSWEGSQRGEDGSYSLPYPHYHPLVDEFFRLLAAECWLDYNYNPEQAWGMLKDADRVSVASLSEIKTMLTYCLRGERFSDGHWEQMIQQGYIRRLLERLNVIRSEMSG